MCSVSEGTHKPNVTHVYKGILFKFKIVNDFYRLHELLSACYKTKMSETPYICMYGWMISKIYTYVYISIIFM